MARRKKDQERVLGPYRNRGKWRIVHVGRGGERAAQVFETESRARRAVTALKKRLGLGVDRTVEEALEAYEKHLREKGNKESSIKQTMLKLGKFFPDPELEVSAIGPNKGQRYYDQLRNAKRKDGSPMCQGSCRVEEVA